MPNLIVPDSSLQVRLASKENASFYPLTLTDAGWLDVPTNHELVLNGVISLGIWLKITSGVGVKVRLVGKFDLDSADFYTLPIYNPTTSAIAMNEHFYSVAADGSQNIVFSLPMADVIRFGKVQVRGVSGTLDDAYLTFRMSP